MREIVDKHFVDNWVVLYVTGHTVDLTLQWSKYHAANAALQNVIDPATAKRIQVTPGTLSLVHQGVVRVALGTGYTPGEGKSASVVKWRRERSPVRFATPTSL